VTTAKNLKLIGGQKENVEIREEPPKTRRSCNQKRKNAYLFQRATDRLRRGNYRKKNEEHRRFGGNHERRRMKVKQKGRAPEGYEISELKFLKAFNWQRAVRIRTTLVVVPSGPPGKYPRFLNTNHQTKCRGTE